MTIIPLLSFAYFLASYILPNMVTQESVVSVLICNIVLSVAGFSILARTIKAVNKLSAHMNDIARGDLSKNILLQDGREIASILQSTEMIVQTLKSDRERLQAFSRNLEKEVEKRTEELRRDIAERKLVEQALRESNMMLSDALSELKEMEHRLIQEERMSALGQMASSIAHDFNNSLMPIAGLSEFLLMNPDTLDDKEELINTLKDIHSSANRATQAVVRLREFYKSDERQDYELVDVNKVFDKVITLCTSQVEKVRQAISSGMVEIRKEFKDVPFLLADEAELRDAVKNVIVNAVEAMPKGGVITCRSFVEGKCVVLEVIDNGTGMTPEVQSRCAEPFFSTKQGHGVGIGLSVVYGILRRHRGNLEIRSELGKGTKVRLLLPLAQAAETKEVVTQTESPDIEAIKILVVDDDVWTRTLLSRFLNGIGHTVITADTGNKGIEAFKREKFDLVITDKAMPDVSGEQVALAVSQSGGKVPVIMLTGFGEIMKDKGQVPQGVSRVMSKPVSLKQLKNAICQLFVAAARAG